MNIVTLDFETYYDDQYTLKKLTTEEYIRDPRFEVLGCGVRWPDGQTNWYADGPPPFTNDCAVLCHHAHFDGLILSHHYGVKPHAWLDTLSMARLLVGNHISVGLDSLAKHFGLRGKTIDYNAFKGKHWAELDAAGRTMLADGCLHDVILTWGLFQRLAHDLPTEEYGLIDTTIRMFTEPTLVGDVQLLGEVWTDEAQKKRDLLNQLGVTADDLQSADRFCGLLQAAGVEIQTKPGKAGPIPAIAKTDTWMKELLDDQDDRVRTLAEARLGVRSTADQTRAERLGFMAQRGAMPVYLSYAGAHTSRWSGGDKVNWQNFRRGGKIRKAIKAPEGHVVIKADKSQVECRFLNYIAAQWDVIERFRNKEDPYVGIASKFYNRPITRDNPAERGVGKQLELSCGYGAGGPTIKATAMRGTYGPPVSLSDADALAARDLYRATHPGVVDLWRQAGRMIARLAGGDPIQWGPVWVQEGRIILPNGVPMLYPELNFHREEDGEEYWRYRSRYGWVKLYGAKLVENLIQGIARVDMGQSMLRLRALGFRIVLTEHDAVAVLSTVDKAEENLQIVLAEMRRAPTWMPEIPLDAEGSYGERYA